MSGKHYSLSQCFVSYYEGQGLTAQVGVASLSDEYCPSLHTVTVAPSRKKKKKSKTDSPTTNRLPKYKELD